MSQTRQDAASRFWLAGSISVALHASLTVLLIFAPLRHGTGTHGLVAVDAVIVQHGDDLPDILPTAIQLPVLPETTPTPGSTEESEPASSVPAPNSMPSHPASRSGSAETATSAVAHLVHESPRPESTFFQIPVRGQSVLFVLDRSASMGGRNGFLLAVKRELLASLAGLPAGARFQVIFYNKHWDMLRLVGPGGLAMASVENKRRAESQIESLTAEGGTEHEPALRAALSLEPDSIYFLTDADDLTQGLVNTITQLNRGRAAIHTVELAPRREPGMQLQMLAQRNRGTYRAVAAK
jgi:hypothetical protein